ncbi:MAG: hypothetical protein RLZ72_1039, partial [Actinomycetota bacterium]
CRTELHDSGVCGDGFRRGPWQHRIHQLQIRCDARRFWFGYSEDSTGKHTSDVCVDNRHAKAERESCDGPGRVRTDSGQGFKSLNVRRDLSPKLVTNAGCRSVHVECAARVTESAPRSHNIGNTGVGEVSSGRPTRDPLFPNGCDSRNGGLLRHYFGQQDSPGSRTGLTPRKRAGRTTEPTSDGANQLPFALAIPRRHPRAGGHKGRHRRHIEHQPPTWQFPRRATSL